MSSVSRFCPHCMGLRNMRATQETRRGAGDKNMMLKFITTLHCETCTAFRVKSFSLHFTRLSAMVAVWLALSA